MRRWEISVELIGAPVEDLGEEMSLPKRAAPVRQEVQLCLRWQASLHKTNTHTCFHYGASGRRIDLSGLF